MNWPDCYGFVRVYDTNGNLKNMAKIRKSFEESKTETTCGMIIAADNNGGVYHVGYTKEDLYDTNKGFGDGFLAKVAF